MLLNLRCVHAVLITVAGMSLNPLLHAQNYPNRPIRLVVPFSAGGAADVPGRMLTQKLSDALAQQVIVDNRPGAGSTIGAEFVAKAPPDGYTLLMISNTHFVGAALHKKLVYDAVNDYAPVTQVTSAPNVIVVHPSLPVKTVRDLIALAKAKPGKIDYASSGNGSTQHLTGALFCKMAGIDMTHIPYRGSGPATADLLAGQVTVGFPGIAGMIGHIKAGKLRALAVTSSRRSPELPDLPTVAQAGVKGYDVTAWFGVAGPKGMPRDVVLKLHAELLRVLKNPELQKLLLTAGQEVAWQETPGQFGEMLKVEAAKWARMVKESGAQVN
ncbi:MAG: tripartite tricarboxylate transporter substrate binding protein [Betaproteobacteria bacterium]|nr:tripartite tricarboxylate transporter substrate binding protein [Betaproteobacteria bacterium]